MVENMKVNGWIIICMAEGYIHGRMVGNMKENINMIKNMDMEYIPGLMEESK